MEDLREKSSLLEGVLPVFEEEAESEVFVELSLYHVADFLPEVVLDRRWPVQADNGVVVAVGVEDHSLGRGVLVEELLVKAHRVFLGKGAFDAGPAQSKNGPVVTG